MSVATAVGPARTGLTSAVLDALPDATALLDGSGTILGVNHAWRMFAVDNGGRPEDTGPGVNYLQVCTRSAAGGCRAAAEVIVGLRAVLAGETVDSEIEYGCPSPAARRWFRVRITPLAGPVAGALVSHVNITRQKMAEQTLAHEPAQDPLTGLANRTLFIDRLIAALTPRSGRSVHSDLGVLYVHLEGRHPREQRPRAWRWGRGAPDHRTPPAHGSARARHSRSPRRFAVRGHRFPDQPGRRKRPRCPDR